MVGCMADLERALSFLPVLEWHSKASELPMPQMPRNTEVSKEMKRLPICPRAIGVLWRPFPEWLQLSWGVETWEAGLVGGGQCLLGLRSPDLELGHRVPEVVHSPQHEVQDVVLLAHQGPQPWLLCGLLPATYVPLQDEEKEHEGAAHHDQAHGHVASAEQPHPLEPTGTPAESALTAGPGPGNSARCRGGHTLGPRPEKGG